MVVVKCERRSFKPLYTLSPVQQFSLFEEELERVLDSLEPRRVSNRALREAVKRKGRRKIRKIKKELKKPLTLKEKKLLYNAFYRVFQRLQWAQEAGSEREVELKVWVTSSIDFLFEVSKLLGDRDG
jgi:hypothetical protein